MSNNCYICEGNREEVGALNYYGAIPDDTMCCSYCLSDIQANLGEQYLYNIKKIEEYKKENLILEKKAVHDLLKLNKTN